MAKRITNQEAKIARLEAELLKAKKAQLVFEQKKFEENDNRLEDLQKKMQSLEDLIATEESSIQKRLKLNAASQERIASYQEKREELQLSFEELADEQAEMMEAAEHLEPEVTD